MDPVWIRDIVVETDEGVSFGNEGFYPFVDGEGEAFVVHDLDKVVVSDMVEEAFDVDH